MFDQRRCNIIRNEFFVSVQSCMQVLRNAFSSACQNLFVTIGLGQFQVSSNAESAKNISYLFHLLDGLIHSLGPNTATGFETFNVTPLGNRSFYGGLIFF